MVLPTEVLCDSGLVILTECSNEPYITSFAEYSRVHLYDIGNLRSAHVIDNAKEM